MLQTPIKKTRTHDSKLFKDAWGRVKTFMSPKYKGSSADYQAECSKCTGIVVAARVMNDNHEKFKYARCMICGMKTYYYCTGCDRPLCFDISREEFLEGKKTWRKKDRHTNDCSKNVESFFRFSCYHYAHSEAWDQHESE